MLSANFNVNAQNAVGDNGTAYNGWLYHKEGLTIGSNLQPQSILHVTNISCDPPCSMPTYIQITNRNSGNTSNTDGFKMGFTNELSLDIVFNQQEDASLRFLTNDIERMRITGGAGYIGIGTNAPTATLDIIGTLRFRTGAINNYVLKTDANGNASWQILNDDNATNELQELSIVNEQLTISNSSNTISLHDLNYWTKNADNLYYNTGNVGIGLTTPASNLHLHNTQTSPFYKALPSGGGNQEDDPPVSQHVTTTFQLTNTNTGEEESDGLVIQSSDYDAIFNLQEDGNMSFITNKNTGLYLKNNGKIGIGTTTPQSCLHIHNSTPTSGGGVGAVSQTGKSGEGIVTIQLTNAITGTSQSDGLFISAKQNNAIINLNETGSFDIKLKDQTAFKIYENKDVQIPSLSGAGFRVVVADFSGKLKIADENMEFDNLGNHTATKNIELDGHNIYNNDETKSLTVSNTGNGAGITMYGNDYSQIGQEWRKGSMTLMVNDGAFRFTNSNGWHTLMTIKPNGNVGIGTSTPSEKLTVKGKILAEEVEIVIDVDNYPDYVFDKDYKLLSIPQLERYIKRNKHLPEIPTTEDVAKNNMKLGEMNVLLLKKIEELTLYIIEQQKLIENMQEQINEINN